MNFRNILWTFAPKKNGTCDIKVYFSHKGKKKYFSTKLCVKPAEWDEKKELVKNKHPLSTRYNAKITRLRLDIERHFLDGGTWANLFKKKDTVFFDDFIRQVIDEAERGLIPLKPGTIGNYRSTLKRIEQYQNKFKDRLELENIDLSFYTNFTDFLVADHSCGLPGISKHVKIIKRVMNIGLERDLHQNKVHQKEAFKRHRVASPDKIFLTEQEIAMLESTDLSKRPAMQRELDRWLVAYYFLMRYSDVIRINKNSLQLVANRWFLKYRSAKTDMECTIPVRSRAMDLLEKYRFDLSWGTNQQANRNIKTAASFAGLTYPASDKFDNVPKYLLLTMHTARRSAATNMYLSGEFSIKTIADLGGWKNIRILQDYLKSSSMDSAILAAKSAYFK